MDTGAKEVRTDDARADPFAGGVILVLTGLVVAAEWGASGALLVATRVLAAVLIARLAFRVRRSRLAFILIGVGLTGVLAASRDDWLPVVASGLGVAAFVAAFFSALSTLRNAASTSPSIRACGRFLAQQPPGRRYAALTVGGQLFALILNYGAIALLGSLAMASAREEPNPEIRGHRIRRMLLAIQRAFIATLPWSPLSFAVAIGSTLIPGASWGGVVLPSMVTGLLIAGIGWAMDTVFKPRLSSPPPPRRPAEGSWRSLYPLVTLLAVLVAVVGALRLATGIRVVGLVILVVPLLSVLWIALQTRREAPIGRLARRGRDFLRIELPGYHDELSLLMMAAFIGTVGAQLLAPLIVGTGFDLSDVPAPLILVALVWLIPLAGQAMMNPILAASLIAPLLPHPEVLGVSPTAVLVAMTAGWALSGASSPFTATTLLIGSFSGRTAWHVGLRWNGAYTLITGAALSVWVVVYALAF